ncbi:MAG: DUF3365 domain-containing protein [Deltaproteobacteria bacterium]|nr:DUF3365 domain-containing protein [Deltaproteobacteria bacterium]
MERRRLTVSMRLVGLVGPLLLVFLLVVVWYFPGRQRIRLLEQQVDATAAAVFTQVAADREYYASVVVPRLEALSLPVVDQYQHVPSAFPLPATFLREVTESVSRAHGPYRIRLVSPWPINKKSGLVDATQRDAFDELLATRSSSVRRRDLVGDVEVMRYWAADRAIHQSCVDCHNGHADSPRRDFHLNDVLGAIEVQIPIAEPWHEAQRDQSLMLFGGLGLSLALIALITWGARRVVTQPIGELAREMARISAAGGVVGEVPPVRRPDDRPVGAEIDQLWHRFEDMQHEVKGNQQRARELSESLEQQRQRQLAFVAGVVHDLRNPLASMKMAAALADKAYEEGSGERYHKAAAMARRQVVQMTRMVGDMLDAARIEAGQLELVLEERDARELAKNVLEVYQPNAIHQLRLTVPDAAVATRCDPMRIEQVLNNLVSNAIKYSPEGTEVELAVAEERGDTVLSVTDHGIGIAPEDVQFLFEPFHRARLARETAPGVGLGLSVAKRIVEAHQGRIEVASSAERGTVFRVRLPRSGPAGATAAAAR